MASIASVVLVIPIPPALINAPVEFEVDTILDNIFNLFDAKSA